MPEKLTMQVLKANGREDLHCSDSFGPFTPPTPGLVLMMHLFILAVLKMASFICMQLQLLPIQLQSQINMGLKSCRCSKEPLNSEAPRP